MDNHPAGPPVSRGVPTWLAVLVSIGVVLAALAVVVREGNRGKPPPAVSVSPAPITKDSAVTPLGKPIPEIVRSYIGTITALKPQSRTFTLSARAKRNYLSEDAVFTVEVGEKTVLRQRTIPAVISAEGDSAPVTTLISFADLQVGDEVTVSGSANLKGRTELAVDEVTKIVVGD